jgi:hypothetical protein
MKLLMLVPVLALAACASSKPDVDPVPKVPEFEVHMMTRTEVITAINQCESNEMKPFVEYITQKTEYGKVMVPVNVHCDPIRRK